MLVFSRTENESFMVSLPDGRTMEITIVKVKGGRVQIGFEAPKDIPILRKELYLENGEKFSGHDYTDKKTT